MAVNLLNMLQGQLGGEVMKQAGKFLGESEANTTSAMNAALPAILGSIVQKGSTQSGASGILDMLSSGGHDGGIFDNLGSMFGGGEASTGFMNSGNSLLKTFLGPKLGGVVDLISSVSGIGKSSSSSLLSMAAPIIMGMLGKQVKSGGLNAGGLMNLLMGQSKYIKDAAPSGVSSLLGFGNLGSKVTETVSSAAATTRTAATSAANTATNTATTAAKSGGSFLKWLLPLLLILGIGGWLLTGKSGCAAADNVLDTTADATKNVAGAAADAAGNAVDATKNVAGAAADAAGNAAGAVAGAAGSAVDAAGNAVGSAADAVGDAAGAVGGAVAGAAAKALEGVKFAAGSIGEGFSKILATGKDAVGKSVAFGNLNFAIGSADIDAASKSEVENLAAVLKAYENVHIKIGGHTDNTGNAAKNKALSDSRAKAVKAMLISMGINGDRIETEGYGDAKPVADNGTAEGRKKNRRIEATITKN